MKRSICLWIFLAALGLTPYEGWAQVGASDKPVYLDKTGILVVQPQIEAYIDFGQS